MASKQRIPYTCPSGNNITTTLGWCCHWHGIKQIQQFQHQHFHAGGNGNPMRVLPSAKCLPTEIPFSPAFLSLEVGMSLEGKDLFCLEEDMFWKAKIHFTWKKIQQSCTAYTHTVHAEAAGTNFDNADSMKCLTQTNKLQYQYCM